VLGYGIIAGACIVKVPQILRFVAAGSVAGVSLTSTYLELLGYVLISTYHILKGNPWSAYGESVILTAQSALIVFMLWWYAPPKGGVAHMAAVSAGLAGAAWTLTQQPHLLAAAQWAATVLFVAARAMQIFVNAAQGHTGELAFLTLFMNAAGSGARIFTSSQEVKDPEVLLSFVISTALNLALLGQYAWYNWLGGRKGAAGAKKKHHASPPASGKRSSAFSGTAAAAAAPSPSSPTEGNGPDSAVGEEAPAISSGGGPRRRPTRKA
jgi:hypothetical protein